MMTDEQRRDSERIERYIEREQLVSTMNNTKWRELEASMARVQPAPPQYRVKCLRDSEPTSEWERDWTTHLPTSKAIEWVDIDPIHRERRGQLLSDVEHGQTTLLVDLLREHSIPYETQSGLIRVYGYRRSAG